MSVARPRAGKRALEKSVVKVSGEEAESPVRQPHGGALRPFQRGVYDPTRQGRGPKKGAPNAGRPPDEIIKKAVEVYGAKCLPFLEQVVDGTPMEKILTPDGEETGLIGSARPETRVKATSEIGKVARLIGGRLDVEHTIGRPALNIVVEAVKKL